MERLVDLFCEFYDSPVFQHISGFLLGIMFMGCIWLIISCYRSDKLIAELENDEDEADEECT